MPKLSKAELETVARQTIRHYDESAAEFWEGTKDHDVTQNYDAFLRALPPNRKLKVLDFGCGPGRDVAYFKSLGHEPTGLDGSSEFCRHVEKHTGCPTLQQNFLDLNLPESAFDGVFANASLFHVPSQELPNVLGAIKRTLVPEGILFSSNPRGNDEGWTGARYGTFLELEAYQSFLETAGFEVLEHYYRPTGKPRAQQPWLAVVSRSTSRR